MCETFLYCDECQANLDIHMQKKGLCIFYFLIYLVSNNLHYDLLFCSGLKSLESVMKPQIVSAKKEQLEKDTLRHA